MSQLKSEQPKQDTSASSLRAKFMAQFVVDDQQTNGNYTDKSVAMGTVNELNNFELMTLTKRNFVPNSDRQQYQGEELPAFQATDISHREIVANIADAERIKALDPTIKRIEQIVVSSIMAPNDLQDPDPEIVIKNELSEIPDNKKTLISELLTKFYCGIYGFRARMTNWVREAHFRSGAGVTVILPEATLTSLLETYDPDRKLLREMNKEKLIGKENLSPQEHRALEDFILSDAFYEKVCSYDPYAIERKNTTVSTTGHEGIHVGLNCAKETTSSALEELLPAWKLTDIVDRTYEELSPIYSELLQSHKNIKTKDIRASLEAMSINFTKAFQKSHASDQQYVRILDNPDMIRLGALMKDKKLGKLHSVFDRSIIQKLLEQQDTVYDQKLYYQDIPIMDLTPFMTDYDLQKAFPIVIDWPTESMIPIIIPGSRSQRVGAFALVDEWGQPIEASSYIIAGNNNPVSNRLSVAYNTMYGEAPTESGIRTTSGYHSAAGIYPNTCGCNKEAITKIFNYILDEMLKKKLQDVGLTDVTLGKYNAIAQCMLFRFFEKKKTRLIFIPEKYLTYLAFDYHFDGTGKSKLEDILYMESNKISLMTAATLAAMKSAVPIKKVVLNQDKKRRSTFQELITLRDAIVDRETFSPTFYPSSITSQILSQNLSIETHHPNAEGMSIQIEDSHREIARADTDFLKQMEDQTIIGLGLPPSALSEVSEVQFARSLATTNLYFAKTIRQDQIVVEEHASDHLRKHLRLSSVLLYKIAEILQDKPQMTDTTPEKDKDEDTKFKPTTPDDGATTVSNMAKKITPEIFNKLQKVIDAVQVKLYPPDVAPDDTQYAILTESIKRVGEYVDAIYPDDGANFGENADMTNTYRLLKSSIKSRMIRELASKLGFRGLISEVPEMEEFLTDETSVITKQYSMLKGLESSLKLTVKSREKKAPEGQEGETTESSSSYGGSLF